MEKIRSIAILLVLALQLPAGITVTRSTSDLCSFDFDIGDFSIHSNKNKDESFTELSFGSSNIITGENGDPAIPGFSVFMGIPPKGAISVTFTAEQTKTIQLSQPPVSIKNPTHEKRQPLLKFSSAYISEPIFTHIRGLRTAQLVIRPFLYDESSRTLRIVTKGHCTVSFSNYPFRKTSTAKLSGYDQMLSKLICNFDMAQRWSTVRGLGKRTAETYPLKQNQKVYTFKIGDGHSGVNEGTINENRVIRIMGNRILQLFGNVPVSAVTLFASHKGELPETVPAEGDIPCGLVEVPLMRIDLNKNGIVDTNDYFLAYVTGASDYVWKNRFLFQLDDYDDYRNYYLTTNTGNGKTINCYVNKSGAGDTLSSFVNVVTFRHSSTISPVGEGGPDWIWKKILPRDPVFQYSPDLPGLDSTKMGKIIFEFYYDGGSIKADLKEQICTICTSGEEYPISEWGSNNLQITFSSNNGSPASNVELKQFEIAYSRKLETDSSSGMTVFSSSDSGIQHYKLKIRSDDLIYIFRITDDDQNISLVDTISDSYGKSYVWSDSGHGGTKYFVCSSKSIDTIGDLQIQTSLQRSGLVIRDLRNTSNSTDFMIITHPDFVSQAESLAVHKKNIGFSKPVVVMIPDIYRFFSGGDVDPSAIRNFLAYVNRSWSNENKLDYVLLFGSGHYDYKGISTTKPIFIPVYYKNSAPVEDYYTFTEMPQSGTNHFSQFALGRLPCVTVSEASAMVRKIIEMEIPEEADYGAWRNRALFVADDDFYGDTTDAIDHTSASDRVASTLQTSWPSIDLRKVYLYEYELNTAREKPEASRAIINEINGGVGFVNFFGHGSMDLWTDEHVLLNENIATMYNQGRYPVITSFSCSVGKFDTLGEKPCLSTALVKADRAGAIICISSTRKSTPYNNEIIADNFYSSQFHTSGSTSAGLAYISAKAAAYSGNSLAYSLLGDPSICIVKAIRNVNLEIRDRNRNLLDTIKALQNITISGSVTTGDGKLDMMFGTTDKPAFIQIGLFNAAEYALRKDGGKDTVRYLLPGKPVYLGKSQVRNGKFEQTVLVPRNVSFDKEGVKLTGYAWKEGKPGAGIGFRKGIIFHGTDEFNIKDTAGPRITIRPVYDNGQSISNASFTDNITSLLPLKCEIVFYDESGIDVSSIGPDEGISMEIPGYLSKRNINNKFQFMEGDFRRGTASIVFDEHSLTPGRHTMNITSRDLLGNLSKNSFVLDITNQNELKLGHVFNFPNPVRMGKTTRFFFYPSNTAQQYYQSSVISAVKIYSLSGRVLRVIKNARNGEVWDGRDQAGNVLGPDIYLYQIVATSPTIQKTVKSPVKKLVINPPR